MKRWHEEMRDIIHQAVKAGATLGEILEDLAYRLGSYAEEFAENEKERV